MTSQVQTRQTPLRVRALLVVLGLMLGMAVVGATPAQAVTAPGNILPPFNVGETWKVYQGYGPNAFSHHNNPGNPPSLYGLDLTTGGSDTSSTGKTVRAPIGGNATYSASSGTLCINTPNNGPSIALTHINTSVPNGAVTVGQEVGTVAAAVVSGPPNNGNVAHIHLQMWSTNGCWGTGNGGMPFDAAHSARICGANDFTASGPNAGGNGIWSGTPFTGRECGTTPPASDVPRIGALQTNGHFLVKEGGLGSEWSDQISDVSSGALAGNRVGVLQTNGHFLVKAGVLSDGWSDQKSDVASASLSSNRIGVLQTNGHFLVKEGGLGSEWSDQKSDAVSGIVLNDRIGVLQTNGHFLVKSGGLGEPWVDVLDNVQTIYMSGSRIAALQTNGHFLVKEGDVNSSWSDQKDNVLKGSLSGNRTGVLQTNGHFLVKEGGLDAGWSDQQSDVVSGVISGNRIGVVQTNGHFLVKEGGLGSSWSDQKSDVLMGGLATP